MNLTVIDHPLARHYLTILRDENTQPEAFRSAARSLTYALVLEATKALPVDEVAVTTPMEQTTGHRIHDVVAIAVLRAGLGMLDAVLDLSWLRAELAPYYSHTGCPSVDPELMIRMLLLGYCYSIRSDRRLCQEVEMNLAYRWFCRLGLEDKVPDHSTFSINRHGRFRDSDILRQVFESVVRGCMDAGLVGGEGFAVDA
ncbi:MAG: transposase, partial [Acidobacteria bacterium]|nr:transposase [Acidobacteriota bacterium]